MIGRPHGSIGVRGNWLMPSAGSDIFDFVTEHLSIEKSDFNTATFAMDTAFMLTPHLDIVAGFDIANQDIESQYRGYSETVRGSTTTIPIQQTTD